MFKTVNGGKLPTRGTKHSACVDLYANKDCVIGAGETKVIGLGVKINVEMNSIDYNYNRYVSSEQERVKDNFLKSHYFQLILRSSLGKKGLILPNGVGIIDMDYKDEIKLIVHNPIHSENFAYVDKQCFSQEAETYCRTECAIMKGNKIAQIILLEHKSYLFDIDTETERNGGIGSTDV